MRNPLPAFLLLFALQHANLSAQEREQITHTSGPKNARTGEVYEVLKEDETGTEKAV
jgi:hypothetical protein